MPVEVGTHLVGLARYLNDNHSCEAYRAKLHNPLITHHRDSEDEDEFASQLSSWKLNSHFTFGLIFVSNHADIKIAPGLPEILVNHELVVVHAIEDDHCERHHRQQDKVDAGHKRLQ